jgi:large repetitive protein
VRSALIGALILVTAACARPISTAQQTPPTPSPSSTPTTPLALSATAPSHNGEAGVAYAPVGLSATGGVQPYTWTISDGQLPAGLTLASDGVSGTPTSAGTFAFSVQVADAGNSSATIPGSVPIAAALSASLIPACATQCSVELGCVSVCGAFGAQGGGVGPYSYALTSGQLPAGTSLSGLTLNGTFVGLSGYLKFTVQVTDGFGATATVTPTFWMYDHISLASDTTACFRIFTACSLRLAISGGVPGGNPSVSLASAASAGPGCWPPSPTPLPTGYTLTVSGGYVNLYIPRPGSGYGGVWTLVLTDHTLCSAGTECTSPGATANMGIECT